MRIIKPSFAIERRDEQRGNLSVIERAGRVCYKSEDKIGDGTAEGFVIGLIQRKHESVLEHGDYIFMLDDYEILGAVACELLRIMKESGQRILLTMTNIDGRPIISGNIRAWRELIAADTGVKHVFAGAMDPIYTADLIPAGTLKADQRVQQLRYGDLPTVAERQAHLRQTVRFIIDRGISHEFVRHRVMSFSQESTRFCNYSQDRFGREITVIEPCFLTPHTEPYDLWKRSCMSCETEYFTMLNMGLQPQEARAVLPMCTKTELMMTGTLGQWQHFFDLRALEKAGRPHPQAVEVAKPLCIEMARKFPGSIVID